MLSHSLVFPHLSFSLIANATKRDIRSTMITLPTIVSFLTITLWLSLLSSSCHSASQFVCDVRLSRINTINTHCMCCVHYYRKHFIYMYIVHCTVCTHTIINPVLYSVAFTPSPSPSMHGVEQFAFASHFHTISHRFFLFSCILLLWLLRLLYVFCMCVAHILGWKIQHVYAWHQVFNTNLFCRVSIGRFQQARQLCVHSQTK